MLETVLWTLVAMGSISLFAAWALWMTFIDRPSDFTRGQAHLATWGLPSVGLIAGLLLIGMAIA